MRKLRTQEVYSDDEIIRRIIDATAPVSGPTDYMVEINYVAPNDCEPPIITARITEHRKDVIYHIDVDQNTSMDDFNSSLKEMRDIAERCLRACKNNTSYREELKSELMKVQDNEEYPF